MTDRRRSAIVGTGMIAEIHARAVRAAGGTVAAVVGRTAESAESAAGRFYAERATERLADVLESTDVDVVHLCTPNHLHVPQAREVLAAGKHLVCEKPIAVDVGDAARLAQEAAASGVVTAVPFVYRFYPSVRSARERVRRRETGPVRLVHGSYLQDWLAGPDADNWRVASGSGGPSRAFADIGIHWCDTAEFVSGHRIARLMARTTITRPVRAGRPVETEDAAVLLFETDQGALGSVTVSQVTPGRKNRLWLSVDGDDESLAFDQEWPEGLWVGNQDVSGVQLRGSGPPGAYDVLPPGHTQGYQDVFTAFVRDVYARADGVDVDGLPTVADGLRSARLTAAVVESAGTVDWVEVPA